MYTAMPYIISFCEFDDRVADTSSRSKFVSGVSSNWLTL